MKLSPRLRLWFDYATAPFVFFGICAYAAWQLMFGPEYPDSEFEDYTP
jgi:hypothetical protein